MSQTELFAPQDRFLYETQCWNRGLRHVAGVDEAGRGPLAGPVVAAAVIFSPQILPPEEIAIDDSKRLSLPQRQQAYEWICRNALAWAVGMVSAQEIDAVNIRQAAFLAMRNALQNLGMTPDYLLVDGFELPDIEIPQTALVKGDRRSFSIAAASILAKVERDRLMQNLHKRWPQYGFDRNKGYPTAEHLAAISRYGLCPQHRRSFRPKKLQGLGIYRDDD